MVKLELDLNKLSDDQLEAYLTLKRAGEIKEKEAEEEELESALLETDKEDKPKRRYRKGQHRFGVDAKKELEEIYLTSPRGWKKLHKRIKKFAKRYNTTLKSVSALAFKHGLTKKRKNMLKVQTEELKSSDTKGMIRSKPLVPSTHPLPYGTKIEPTAFPKIYYIDGGTREMLVKLVANMIKLKTKLTYKMEGPILGFSSKDCTQWNQFTEDFMANSIKIADYFGAPNLFHLEKHVGLGGFALRYG
jgi:hypothetical protein